MLRVRLRDARPGDRALRPRAAAQEAPRRAPSFALIARRSARGCCRARRRATARRHEDDPARAHSRLSIRAAADARRELPLCAELLRLRGRGRREARRAQGHACSPAGASCAATRIIPAATTPSPDPTSSSSRAPLPAARGHPGSHGYPTSHSVCRFFRSRRCCCGRRGRRSSGRRRPWSPSTPAEIDAPRRPAAGARRPPPRPRPRQRRRARRRRPAPTRQPAAAGPHDHDRHRSLPRGDRHRRAARSRRSRCSSIAIRATRRSPTSRCSRRPSARSSRSRDCWARACRTIAPSTRREPGPRELAPGADRIELKLQAIAPNGDKIVQMLTFHRGTLRDRRRLRRHQRRHRADRAVRVLPVHARHQDAGLAQLDGAGLVRRPGHLQRDRQVQEGRIRRARQARGRSVAQAPVHEERRQRLGRDGRALLRRRVAAGRRQEDAARVLRAQARRRPLRGGRDRCRSARSRPARPAEVDVPLYVGPAGAGRARAARQGPRPRRRLRHLHRASRRRSSGSSSGCTASSTTGAGRSCC